MFMKKRRSPGFTLVEVIVVLIILAILAAIGIPALLGYIEKTQRGVCLANTAAIARIAQPMLLLDDKLAGNITADSTYLFDYVERENLVDGDGCPTDGTYRAYLLANNRLMVVCSRHPEGASGKIITDIAKEYQANSSGFLQGSDFRKEIIDRFGGELPAVMVDGTAFFLKINYDGNPRQVMVFASPGGAGNAGTQWQAKYYYDNENDQWYHYKADQPKETFMTAGKNNDQILQIIKDNPADWTPTKVIP